MWWKGRAGVNGWMVGVFDVGEPRTVVVAVASGEAVLRHGRGSAGAAGVRPRRGSIAGTSSWSVGRHAAEHASE